MLQSLNIRKFMTHGMNSRKKYVRIIFIKQFFQMTGQNFKSFEDFIGSRTFPSCFIQE